MQMSRGMICVSNNNIPSDQGGKTMRVLAVADCTLGRGGGALVALADGQRPRVKML